MGRGERGSHDPSEKEIRREIFEWLYTHPAIGFVMENDFRRDSGRRGGVVGKYRPKGISDIHFMFRGTGIAGYIEVKKRGGKATPEQIAFLEKIENAGGFSALVFSLEDLKLIFRSLFQERE
jgi:hypothetical protein